ncbi:hypothetical protein QF037_006076 [Streptomyces canus]|nr:hypothetical protein [Streptomyces canus]
MPTSSAAKVWPVTGTGEPGNGHRELGGKAGERGAAEHERDVPDTGGRQQVGEDLAGAGRGDGGAHGDSARV